MGRRQRNGNETEKVSRRKSWRALRKGDIRGVRAPPRTLGELVTASRVFIIGVLYSRTASTTICLTLGYASLKKSLDQIISLVPYIAMIKFWFLLHFPKQNFLWFFSF